MNLKDGEAEERDGEAYGLKLKFERMISFLLRRVQLL